MVTSVRRDCHCWDMDNAVRISDTLGRAFRHMRIRARAGQSEVATAMRAAGFPTWSRVTVADIERGARKLTVDEAFALARLWEIDIADVLPAGAAHLRGTRGDRCSNGKRQVRREQHGCFSSQAG